jgi:guanylate kinase
VSEEPRRGTPFVVAAPSGTGKTTVCRAVVQRDPGVRFSVSHTTRKPRTGERDGVDYHFVSSDEFLQKVQAGDFLEHAEYAAHLYGTSWAALEAPLAQGADLLLEIEVQGAAQVKERLAEAGFIFLLPPSMRVLEDRLRGRGTDSEEVIAHRLALADRELDAIRFFDYAVVNDEFEVAVDSVLEIIAAEREGRGGELLERYGRDAVLAGWPTRS